MHACMHACRRQPTESCSPIPVPVFVADLLGLLKELPRLPTVESQATADHRKVLKELKDLRVMLDPQLAAMRKLRSRFGKGGALRPTLISDACSHVVCCMRTCPSPCPCPCPRLCPS